MDFDLTDEQQLIRETARQFADRELAERARENDRNHHFDTELVAKMDEQGYLGAVVPLEYGGALEDMPPLALGRWHHAEHRRYRFRVKLPDRGSPPSPTTGDLYWLI